MPFLPIAHFPPLSRSCIMVLERAVSPLVVFLFLLLATFAQVLLALYGLLSRYLQVGSLVL